MDKINKGNNSGNHRFEIVTKLVPEGGHCVRGFVASVDRLYEANKSKYVAIFAALITFAVYLPALSNGFVNWDDRDYVYNNPHIQSLDFDFLKWALLDFHVANWHPLSWLSHAIDYGLWGLNPAGHHLTSIVLHAANTMLVVLFCIRVVEAADKSSVVRDTSRYGGYFVANKIAIGFIAGLIFGLHPIHVESVVWISERKDVLCAFFVLLALLEYVRYRDVELIIVNRHLDNMRRSSYLSCLGFFILALLSKPMAVTLPAVLLILDWYPFNLIQKKNLRTILIEKLPFLILSLLVCILAIIAQAHGGAVKSSISFPYYTRLLVGTHTLILYLYKMLWPAVLLPFYLYPRHVSMLSYAYALPIILAITITGMCLFLSKRNKFWMVIWAVYFVTLLPVIGIIQIGVQSGADRYTYIPSVGPILLASMCIVMFLEHIKNISGWIRPLFIFMIIIAYSYLTINQIRIWKNGITLWTAVIQHIQQSSADDYYFVENIYVNRGIAYAQESRFYEAVADETKAIEIDPDNVNAFMNRGVYYANLGLYSRALDDENNAIRLQPDNSELYYNRGNNYARLNRFRDAIRDYTIAISLSSYPHREYYYNRSVIYKKIGLFDAAERDMVRFSKLSSGDSDK